MNQPPTLESGNKNFDYYKHKAEEIIRTNRDRTMHEYTTTDNPFLACLVTPLASIRGNLEAMQRKIDTVADIDEKERDQTELTVSFGCLDGLDAHVLELQKTYNTRKYDVPEDIREQILGDIERILG